MVKVCLNLDFLIYLFFALSNKIFPVIKVLFRQQMSTADRSCENK